SASPLPKESPMHSRLSACLLLLLTGTVAGAAHAHFAVDMGDTHESRYGPGEIKSPPCGRPDGERGEKVHTYKPGEIIDVSWVEFVAQDRKSTRLNSSHVKISYAV